MSMLEIQNLVKKYNGHVAVDNISLNIEKGELFGLLGPNGAGKSTTISVISTLLKPTSGSVLVNGHSVVACPDRVRGIIGLVPQEIALYPMLTAGENLAFFGRMYGLGGGRLKDRVKQVLDIVGLSERSGEKVATFSGGMKRRINIGVGMMNMPELLILDEPTVGIDPQSRRHILDTVKELNSRGMTVIYTSHYMEEVEYLCRRVGIMDRGRLIALGSKEELKKLAGEKETLEIKVVDSVLVEPGAFKSLPGVEGASCREDRITLVTSGAGGLLPEVLALLEKERVKIKSINILEPDLESVFLRLTGSALRD